MSSEVDRIVDVLGDDVQPLDGSLFRIRRDRIQYAPSGMKCVDGQFQFGNPRWHTVDGRPVAEGFTPEEMNDLRCSIRDEGLIDPLRLRIKEDGTVETINGERRLRSVDGLIAAGEIVFDLNSKTKRPASEVFEWIECRLSYMTDEEAIRAAMRPNDTGRRIGDVASLSVIKTLRDAGHTPEAIAGMVGRSLSWIKQSFSITADPELTKALETKEINRRAAIDLLEIEDATMRKERLDQLREVVGQRINMKRAEIEQKIQKTASREEIAAGERALAEADGDFEAVAEAEHQVERIRQARQRQESSRERVGQRRITGRDTGKKQFSLGKIDKAWRPKLTDLIEEGGTLGERAEFALAMLDAMRDGLVDPDDEKKPYPIEILLGAEDIKVSTGLEDNEDWQSAANDAVFGD